MDTVTIDGVEYVKASVLAKKLRYTSDYIGQLCRAKKVDAHLVGRTWYVYPPSLEGHKSTRYAELRSGEKNAILESKLKSSRIEVNAPVSKALVRNQKPNFHNRVFWKPTPYESDDAELMPFPAAKTNDQPLRMNVRLADAERLRVAAVSQNVSMISQPLPAVALSGTLKVQDFSPTFDVSPQEDDLNNVENTSDSDSSGEGVGVPLHEEESAEEQVRYPEANSSFGRRLISQTAPAASSKRFATTRGRAHGPVASEPERSTITLPAVKSKQRRGAQDDPRSSLFFKLVIAPAVLLLMAGVVATLLAVETVTVAGGGEQVASLRFEPSLVVNFLTPW